MADAYVYQLGRGYANGRYSKTNGMVEQVQQLYL